MHNRKFIYPKTQPPGPFLIMGTIITAILFTGIISCSKEKNTYSNSYGKNTTFHTIKVQPYKNGVIDNNTGFQLQANESKQIYYNNTRGKNAGLTYGAANQPADSFLVTFDNLWSIVHYKPTLVGNSSKRYLYSSRRNLYNDSSYVTVLSKDTKYSNHWEFTYTFTEQDYLDAQ